MPKLAFQRAKLSSSASNFAYSSRLLAAVGLYPIELSVRSCPGLVANDDYGTWGGTRGQIFFMWGLNRGVISLLHVCFRVGVDIHSCLGNGWSLSAVIFSGRGCHWSLDSETTQWTLLFIDNGNYRTVTWGPYYVNPHPRSGVMLSRDSGSVRQTSQTHPDADATHRTHRYPQTFHPN